MIHRESFEIIHHQTSPIKDHHHFVPSQNPGGCCILRAGTVQAPGHRPLLSDIVVEEDVPIQTRDGTILYANVFRPAPTALGREGEGSIENAKIPAIIAAGPFGKNGGPNKHNFDKLPFRFGCPRVATSGLEKFEGPDPGYWCYHGYAVVHTDCRGTWQSQGDVIMPSKKEGEDNYDVIEYIAQLPWSNGKVTMSGNSYLAITQWFTGAEQPPHLACLAPWEGASSMYDDIIRRGGVPNPGFWSGLLRGDIASSQNSKTIDVTAMCYQYPVRNNFWDSVQARFDRIQCPLYIVASWTNHLHTRGTFRAWEECASRAKWLRVHNRHEWPDLYDPQNVEDLRRFYDYYMKGVNNDWHFTPRVRLSILDAGGLDIVNRPESTFPLLREQPLKLFLHPDIKRLGSDPPSSCVNFAYDAQTGDATFRWPNPTPTRMEFTGYMKLRLWAESQGSNDMDVFATLKKLNTTTNKVLESLLVDVGRLAPDPEAVRQQVFREHSADPTLYSAYFASGPMGCLRASHRELDESRSTMYCPVYTHRKEQFLEPGQIVPMDIAVWPYGMIVNPGEELQLTISGYHPSPHCRPTDPKPELRNKGKHIFHVGGEYDSYLLLPWIANKDTIADDPIIKAEEKA